MLPLVESSRVFAGDEFSGAGGLGNDAGSRTIFHRAARVDPLGFRKHLRVQIARDALEPQQRRIANAF